MDLDTQEQPLMRKSYLVILAVALVIMLILNPGAIRRVLPDRFQGSAGRTARSRSSTGGTSGASAADGSLRNDVEAIRRDLDAFRAWIVDEAQTPTPVIQIVERASALDITRMDENPTRRGILRYRVSPLDEGLIEVASLRERLVVEVPDGVVAQMQAITNHPQEGYQVTVAVKGAGRVALRDRDVPEMPPVYYDVQMRSTWPVDIVGIVGGDEAGWTAIRGNRAYAVGDLIDPPDDTRTPYQVVNVSRQCVWLRVQEPSAMEPSPVRRWSLPDIRRIVLSPTMIPARVEIREGVSLAPGESLTFGATGSSLTAESLWRNSVHFRYRLASGEVHDLVCVIVR